MSELGRLRTELSDAEGIPAVRFFGEVDMSTVEELSDSLRQAGKGSRDLVVDLRGITFMDSSGINAIVGIHRDFDREGRRLLIATSQAVRRVFEVTGLHEKLNLLD